MITSLVYFAHCIVRTSSIYGFWLLLWYILVIVLPVLCLFTDSDYSFGIFFIIVFFLLRLFASSDYFFGIIWSLYCTYLSIKGFWLPLWYIGVIVLSVLRLFTASDYSFGILWSLYCPYSVYLRLLITPLVYFFIVLSVHRLFMAFDYSIGIFWWLHCLYFVCLRLLITSLVYFGHCIVNTSSIYGFWLLLWYILVIVLSIRRLFTASDYPFGIFCPLYCPYFVNLRLPITSLVYFDYCISVLRLFLYSD